MSNNPHPAHKEILDKIPEALHETVMPILKKWDQGVQEKIAEVKSEYAGYEPFVKNKVDPKFVEQAVVLAEQLQNDPKGVMERVNDTWGLGFVPKDSLEQEPSSEESDLFSEDIMKHPKVKAMAESLDKLQSQWEETTSAQEEREAERELQEYLKTLEEEAKNDNVPFSREFVTAYMAAGVDGKEALKEYHKIIGQASTQEQPEEEGSNEPPEVMGSGGTQGSGNETPTFDYAGKKDDVNQFVADLIKAQGSGDE